MANIRKSFNFRTGLQVDNENFVVNSNGLVGIGTSIPRNYKLDVYGSSRVSGLVTSSTLYANSGTINTLNSTNSTVGTLTATNIEATSLTIGGSGVSGNFIGYAFTAWITNDGGVGLHTLSRIGIGTDTTPTEQLRVVGDAAITDDLTLTTGNLTLSAGNLTLTSGGINASSGVVTASSFSGSLSSSDLTGTIDNARLPTNINKPTGIITASSFVGNLTGTATTATNLDSSANITAVSVSAGIVTASTRLYTPSIGVGTNSPDAQIHLRKSGVTDIQLTSDGSYESTITLGRNTTKTTDNGQIRFGYTGFLYPQSTEQSLDIINYDTGNLNFYLEPNGLGGSFNWLTNASNRAMVLTQTGNLGIGKTSPSQKLDVTGNIAASGSITGNSFAKVGGASTQFLKADGSIDENTYLISTSDGSGLSGIVTSLVAGSNITVSGSTGQVTISASGGGSVSRQSLAQSTGSIGAGTTSNITITGYKTYALQKVGISSAAWVVLYTDADSRTADASRNYLTDPTPGSGVIAEVYTTNTGISTFIMSPGIIGWNDDATPSTNIYARVTNNESSSADITVTLTAVKLED